MTIDTLESTQQIAGLMQDRDGHVREAAIRRAAQIGAPALLPAVATRLNDWVAPVRDLARTTVLDMLANLAPDRDGDIALQLVVAVTHLKRARRADHSEWIARFEQCLIDVMGAGRIVDAIGHARPAVALACFVLADTHRLAATALLCQRGLANKGNFGLAYKAMHAARALAHAEQYDVYRQALDSPAGLVRADALRALLRADSAAAPALAQSMLADGNAWVRMIASAYLTKGGCDVAATYAGLMAGATIDARTLRACLAGLAESDAKTYLDLVRSYADDDRARVQVAAYLAWVRLAPNDKDLIAERLLHSRHRRVRKLFDMFTTGLGAYVASEIALPLMRAHGDHGQMLALARGKPWTMLEVIATIAAGSGLDGHLEQTLRRELASSMYSAERGYTRPTAAQLALLQQRFVQQTLTALLGRDRRGQDALVRELEAL